MKIEFNVIEGFEWVAEPLPAAKAIPDWYRRMPQRQEPSEIGDSFPHGTAKLCSPFADAMSAGYVLRLPFQCFVRALSEGEISMTWVNPVGQAWALVEQHSATQFPGVQFQDDYPNIFKWMLPWSVRVPEGYAALYTHPLNRPDLPFQTFSGLVDAGYDSPVNFPFIWVAGEQETIIDAGTPVAQVIPVRLDEWEHEIGSSPAAESWRSARVAASHITGYRRLFRRNKTWQ